ncbi:hypothetical protein L6164_016863 [Bauhinia variegata]|uniref:Uncharacterized protein n=1 Tax=Bauhinia variegata TaxID=167791 RepID=A0ACB9N5U7_BAUVA|nr:hypothetical protein L6164_016863 [Bauhinia variegata]
MGEESHAATETEETLLTLQGQANMWNYMFSFADSMALKSAVELHVGRGIGEAVSEIVKSYPHIKCINFDLPHVVATASKYEGVTHVGGDMLQHVPSHSQGRRHLHEDFEEVQGGNTRRERESSDVDFALKPEGDGILDDTGFVFDLLMIAYASGGRERTELEWMKILQEAGFPCYSIITIKALLSIIEAYPI